MILESFFVFCKKINAMKEYVSLNEKKDAFNEWCIINTEEELTSKVEELLSLQKNTKLHVVFRGVNEAKYKMYNSFQRLWIIRDLSTIGMLPINKIQSMIDYCYSSVLPPYLKRLGIICNDWYILAFLQHYGAVSPFLDFSKQLFVALFFACDNVVYHDSDNEIDNYISIYFYKNVDVINAFSNSVYKIAETKAQNIDHNDKEAKKRFWKDYMSFRDIMAEQNNWVIVPAYTNVSTIRNSKKKKITNYAISNLNSTSQDGEFVCNMNMNLPLELLMVKDDRKFISCINIHKGLIPYIIKKFLEASLDTARMKYYVKEQDIAKQAEKEAF